MRENGRKSSSRWVDSFNKGADMRKFFLSAAVLTRAINRWQQMALRGKAKLKRSVSTERRPLLEKQGERGESIWQSRSQPFVICLWLGLITFGLIATSATAAETPLIGVVNFASCIAESKAGKKEQENMESIRKQMSTLIDDTEKELKEISSKFEDTEYLDSLSPKAEEELKVKFQALQDDLGRYQNQFYQVLNHANYQMIQKISTTISKAAEKVAGQKTLDYVMNKEACFYIRPDLDVTSLVIAEMDKDFELDVKAKKLTENSEELQIKAVEETTLDKAG